MFDKFKQLGKLNQLRSQAKTMQRELEQIKQTEENAENKVRVSGDQKVEYLVVDGKERSDLVDLINRAMKNVQKESAKKMLEMGGGLSGLLGKM